MCGHIGVDNLSPVVAEHHQNEEHSKACHTFVTLVSDVRKKRRRLIESVVQIGGRPRFPVKGESSNSKRSVDSTTSTFEK